jgi:hypothetical protein
LVRPARNTRAVALLYVDMLGMKARYQRGGPRSAMAGSRILCELVQRALEALPAGRSASGGVQSDAACLQFASTLDAVTVGKLLFSEAFMRSKRNGLVWIRGVIVDGGHPEAPLEETRPLDDVSGEVFVRSFSPPLLRAIYAEQSGFHGQRLLIENELVTKELNEALRQSIGNGHLLPAHKLRYSRYPAPTGHFRDVLWPAPADFADWRFLCRRMVDRLRWASDGGDQEFIHASATNLLFEEINSIVHGLTSGG